MSHESKAKHMNTNMSMSMGMGMGMRMIGISSSSSSWYSIAGASSSLRSCFATPNRSPCCCRSLSLSLLMTSALNPVPSPILRVIQRLWTGRTQDNNALIDHLQAGGMKSKKVADVMRQIDRGLFVPKGGIPYADSPMPIGFNATISAPHMHALCLNLLEEHLQPGMHALDVGSGTGYLTSCFALMVGEKGCAIGVEHIPELVKQSIENIKRTKVAHLLASGRLQLHVGDGREGWAEQSPYDVIHVGAAAASEVPPALLSQLKPGGRMLIPVGTLFQDLKVIDKEADGKSIKEWIATSVRYVPLTDKDNQIRDGF